jgi:hypothetical protein
MLSFIPHSASFDLGAKAEPISHVIQIRITSRLASDGVRTQECQGGSEEMGMRGGEGAASSQGEAALRTL